MSYILVTLVFTSFVMAGGAIAGEIEQGDRTKLSPQKAVAVRTQSLPKMRVACVRNIGPYEKTSPAWKKLIVAADRT